MRIPILPFVVMIIVSFAIDLYIYVAARRRCRTKEVCRVHVYSAILLYVLIAVGVCLPRRSGSDNILHAVMWILFGVMSVYIPKVLYVAVDLMASQPVLFKKKRCSMLSLLGGIGAVLLFLAIWWGALVNRYNVQVTETEVVVKDLPESFDGYRIVQFSDMHVGTFGCDTSFVSHFVDKVNSLNGDLIVFTGDIVNRRSDELRYHIGPLSRLDAIDGVLAILGNHDYGDYCDWESNEAKQANMVELYGYNSAMGWDLLRNDYRMIYRGGDSIAVVGVENVGDPPFTVYGSLSDSYPDLSDCVSKVLLSHNPAHWQQEIAGNDSINIGLTLSGHTHAMQMCVAGISPAVMRYKYWGGLYADETETHKLYVNIGCGTVGMPMRLGATPEISVITLRKADK